MTDSRFPFNGNDDGISMPDENNLGENPIILKQSKEPKAITIIPFHGTALQTFEHEGKHWTAMRPIVEGMGLAWQRQSEKLKEQKTKFNCHHMVTVAEDGKLREMLCIPVEKLALWMASINPNKVSKEIQPKVEAFQAECAIALHDYWTKGVAVRDYGFDAKTMGGIMKSVVQKQRHEMMQEMTAHFEKLTRESIDKSIEAYLTSGHRVAVLERVSIKQVLDEMQIPQKGRRSLQSKVFSRVSEHFMSSTKTEARRCARTRTWLFPYGELEGFIRTKCDDLIKDHWDGIKGQGHLNLVIDNVTPLKAPPSNHAS
jgi:P22_AR N-terminal domain